MSNNYQKIKPFYDLGDWVSVSATVYFSYKKVPGKYEGTMIEKRVHNIIRFSDPIIGRVIGMIYRCEGDVDRAYDVFEPTTFIATRKVPLYKVSRGWTNIPMECREEDMEYHYGKRPEFPVLWMGR